MNFKERKILHLKFGLALLKVIAERKEISDLNKSKGIKDHKLISSLRKLAAASGIDYGTIQKISKGDQGFQFFTLMDILEALDLDLIHFSKYFYEVSDEEIKVYHSSIQKSRKENPSAPKKNKKKRSEK